MKRIFLSIFIIGFIAAAIGGATTSVFQSSAVMEENNFSTGTWYTGPDVVINELMWMGSWGSEGPEIYDEWIELRNMTDSPIDISGWQLTKKSGGSEVLMLTIGSGTIPANGSNGYFLISNYAKSSTNSALNVDPALVDPSVSLANSDLQIKLYNGDWNNIANLIDTADDGFGSPLAGLTSGIYRKSMARNNNPGDGTSAASWHTTIDESANDTTYWKIEGSNYGTPGGLNV
ncbi:MAG: lamin tail domain-containing protein [Candidatus Berkelbacteria bacterium]|nr:lamin tail domain-containing protein [Candidatus Berkelbacteria bacterium]